MPGTVTTTPRSRPHLAGTAHRPGPLATTVAAWSSAVLLAGGFALVSTLPTAVVAVGAWRNPRLGPVRTWATALATGQVTLLLVWLTAADPAPSLSKSLDPVVVAAMTAVAVGTAAACHLQRRRLRDAGRSGARRPR
ncbi:hypothetical protein [Kineococcus sp. SYSU DK002]|uniref:hypothetical protein n=1 Tax=Kineococcus sp. SYSU DK002 TaxID=3383123 RepID=UPI003D7C4BE2